MLLAVLFVVAAAVPQARPAPPSDPIPKRQTIDVKDGDTVVIHDNARVRIVRRRESTIRAIYNSEQRWLVLVVDYVDPGKGAPDGSVDSTFTFQELDGVWPLGERWEGRATLDEYSMFDNPGGSLGITTDGAFVQLLSGSPSLNRDFAAEHAVALRYSGGGRSNAFPGSPKQGFDEIETRAIADVTRNVANHGNSVRTSPFDGPGGSTMRTRVGMTASSSSGGVVLSETTSPSAAVRVGSGIIAPAKIADAKPVLPPAAAQAGVRGVVILEIVVGADGSVTDAKVLRSIPLLDQAALDAVKQWRYTPTLLNGQAVPVIMTVTVAFP